MRTFKLLAVAVVALASTPAFAGLYGNHGDLDKSFKYTGYSCKISKGSDHDLYKGHDWRAFKINDRGAAEFFDFGHGKVESFVLNKDGSCAVTSPATGNTYKGHMKKGTELGNKKVAEHAIYIDGKDHSGVVDGYLNTGKADPRAFSDMTCRINVRAANDWAGFYIDSSGHIDTMAIFYKSKHDPLKAIFGDHGKNRVGVESFSLSENGDCSVKSPFGNIYKGHMRPGKTVETWSFSKPLQ